MISQQEDNLILGRIYIAFKTLLFIGVIGGFIGCSSAEKTKQISRKTDLTEKEQLSVKRNFLEGCRFKVLGDNESAMRKFRQCLSVDQYHHASMYELAQIYESAGDGSNALMLAKVAATVDKENIWYSKLLARLYESSGQYDLAIKVNKKLLKKNSKDEERYYTLANLYVQSGQDIEAIKLFDQLEKQQGPSIELFINKQRLYANLKEYDKAIVELDKAIAIVPEEVKFYGIKADLLQKQGKNEEALKAFNRIVDLDPENPYVHLSLSDLYRKQGDFEKEHQELLKSFRNSRLGVDPKVSILMNYFTLSGIKENAEGNAIELCKALVETHPKEAKSYSIFGDFLYRSEQLNEARDIYAKAKALDEGKFVLWTQVIQISSELKDFRRVQEEASAAQSVFPNQAALYLYEGIGSLQLKEFDRAIKALDAGKNLVFDNDKLLGQFYANLGEAYYKSESYVKCDTAYEKSIDLDPDNTFILNNYSYYLSLRNDRLERAEQLSKHCNELQPNIPSFADTYAWILFNLGKYTEAKTWLDKAIQFGGSDSPAIREHYGDVMFKLNDVGQALENWKKAKSLGSKSTELDDKIKNKRLP